MKENFPSAWGWLWCAQEMKGDYAGAFESFIKWKKIEKDEHVEDYRKAYESAGWQGVKWKILEVSQLNEGKSESNSYELAQEAAFLREKDRAFAYLNKAFEKRQTEMVMLNVDPQLDALRDDPRFDELVRRVGLK